jgi:hypothetical protein
MDAIDLRPGGKRGQRIVSARQNASNGKPARRGSVASTGRLSEHFTKPFVALRHLVISLSKTVS